MSKLNEMTDEELAWLMSGATTEPLTCCFPATR